MKKKKVCFAKLLILLAKARFGYCGQADVVKALTISFFLSAVRMRSHASK